jgi:Domain of unknown function (DUF4347)
MIRPLKGRQLKSFRNRRQAVSGNSWSVSVLEKRLMLAADFGVAISDAATASVSAEVGSASPVQSTAVSHIVFIDSNVDAMDHLIAGLDQGHELIMLDANRDTLSQISEVLAGRANVGSVHIKWLIQVRSSSIALKFKLGPNR